MPLKNINLLRGFYDDKLDYGYVIVTVGKRPPIPI